MPARSVSLPQYVYDHIAGHGVFGESVGDVLTRLLGIEDAAPADPGSIKDLIDADVISPGDEFYWLRPRKGREHTVVVTEEGSFRLDDGSVVPLISQASRAYNPDGNDGMRPWIRRRDGAPLRELRNQVRGPIVKRARRRKR